MPWWLCAHLVQQAHARALQHLPHVVHRILGAARSHQALSQLLQQVVLQGAVLCTRLGHLQCTAASTRSRE